MNEKQVLSALGDLTNGALNYYQAPQTVLVRDELIRNYITNLQKQNTELKEKINTYENPEDLTLMFMYCDEKAKDKIKELKDNWNKLKEWLEDGHKRSLQPYYECGLEYEDVLDKMQEIEGGMNETNY